MSTDNNDGTLKLVSEAKIKSIFKDKMTIMIGGFMSCGAPIRLIELLIESGVKELTLICSDTGTQGVGVGKLIDTNQVKKVLASHIGLNPITGAKMNQAQIEVNLIPQGTLAEQIRAAGAGLGGILTPTGVGTLIEDGKQVLTIDDQKYLLELPLKADIALIKGSICDDIGNTIYKGTTSNFNPIMATAAKLVILEADEILKDKTLRAETIHTSSIYVDMILDQTRR